MHVCVSFHNSECIVYYIQPSEIWGKNGISCCGISIAVRAQIVRKSTESDEKHVWLLISKFGARNASQATQPENSNENERSVRMNGVARDVVYRFDVHHDCYVYSPRCVHANQNLHGKNTSQAKMFDMNIMKNH